MVVANKTRDDLISGTHKRQAFSRELKKMLEERVLSEYNRRQLSAEDTIRVEEVLISDFVTQGGT
jgi:CRISPR/Cas system-associated endonuclease Cas1